jgi:hypothetical protein
MTDLFKKPLNKSIIVIPAQAGIQLIQRFLDSRLRGKDLNQSFLK